jgi:hypothetical protein
MEVAVPVVKSGSSGVTSMSSRRAIKVKLDEIKREVSRVRSFNTAEITSLPGIAYTALPDSLPDVLISATTVRPLPK